MQARGTEALRQELEELLPGRCSAAAAVLDQHGRDESYHPVKPPGVKIIKMFTAPSLARPLARMQAMAAAYRLVQLYVMRVPFQGMVSI